MSNYLAKNDFSRLPNSLMAANAQAAQRVMRAAPPVAEVPVNEIWRVLHKRRLGITLWTLGTLAVVALLTFAFAPKYRSTAIVQVNKENSVALGVDDLTGKKTDEAALDFTVTLETHAAALKSDA